MSLKNVLQFPSEGYSRKNTDETQPKMIAMALIVPAPGGEFESFQDKRRK